MGHTSAYGISSVGKHLEEVVTWYQVVYVCQFSITAGQ